MDIKSAKNLRSRVREFVLENLPVEDSDKMPILSGDLREDLRSCDLEDVYQNALEISIDELAEKVYDKVGFRAHEDGMYTYAYVLDDYDAYQVIEFLRESAKQNRASDKLLALIDDLSDWQIEDFLNSENLALDLDGLYEFFNEQVSDLYYQNSKEYQAETLKDFERCGVLWEDFSLDDMYFYFDFVYEAFKRYASSEFSIEG